MFTELSVVDFFPDILQTADEAAGMKGEILVIYPREELQRLTDQLEDYDCYEQVSWLARENSKVGWILPKRLDYYSSIIIFDNLLENDSMICDFRKSMLDSLRMKCNNLFVIK